METERSYAQRWRVLLALIAIVLCLQFSLIVPAGAVTHIMSRYGLDGMEFTMVMSIPYLSGVLLGIPMGVLADRYGIGRIILFGQSVPLIGAIWRLVSGESFLLLMISTALMGLSNATLNSNSTKVVRLWFPGRTNPLAMGLYLGGFTMGAALALFFGTRASSVEECWWFGALLLGLSIIAWLVLYRRHPDGEGGVKESVLEHLGVVLRNKYVWGISLTAFVSFAMTGINANYMVAAMIALAGDPSATVETGNISTVNTLLICVISIFGGQLVIARFQRMRVPMAICLIGTALISVVWMYFPFGVITWVAMCAMPFFEALIPPMIKSLPALIPGVKKEHLGAVGGVQSTFQNLGNFLVVSYIVAPIATAVDPSAGVGFYRVIYISAAVMCVLVFLGFLMFPNVRTTVEGKRRDDVAA